MPRATTNHVEIKGICCALPDNPKTTEQIGRGYFDEEIIKQTSNTIGVKTIFYAKEGQTASDLCFEAAENLMNKLNWERDSVDGLLFISQTPDYKLPATACVLQNRLGLSIDCIALDINLGCSGFVNGLFLASQMIELGTCKRVLVLVGDTLRNHLSPRDRGITFIISDSGTATALEYVEERKTSFIMYSDGSGAEDLIVRAGGERIPSTAETRQLVEEEENNWRSKEHVFMNGMGIFTFAVKRVPAILREISAMHGWEDKDVKKYLLHQANAYMIKYISKRAKIGEDKIPINIHKFGNTNGSTIPVLLCDLFGCELQPGDNVILCGFGVGLSWGAAAMTIPDLSCAEIMYV